ELTWVHWDSIDEPLIEFTAALARLRREHPTFRRSRFFNGRPVRREVGAPVPDIAWLRPDGTEMQPEDWETGFGRAVGVFLNGAGIRERDRRGEPIADNHFIVLFNAGDEPVDFQIPAVEYSPRWDILVDSAGERADVENIDPGATVMVQAKAMLVLIEHQGPPTEVDHSVAASLAAVSTSSLNLDDMPSPSPKTELGR
ncbi:MAG: glycogen debranching protein GlgX, partial [Microbacterium sp.]